MAERSTKCTVTTVEAARGLEGVQCGVVVDMPRVLDIAVAVGHAGDGGGQGRERRGRRGARARQ